MKIISVVGARPNFMKIAPFVHAIQKHNQTSKLKIEHVLVHTGQHYDDKMSKTFFEELNIPNADINLGIGSGTHAEQVGNTMIAFEKVLKQHKPDWVVVVGDVNATLACSITAKKEWIKCCHIEAGLRSNDLTMPEEINRLVTDRLSDLLLTPDSVSTENLRKEGTDENRIMFVGNIMIDTLDANLDKSMLLNIDEILNNNLLKKESNSKRNSNLENYALITMHRPSNVDIKEVFVPIIRFILDEITNKMNVIWPIHPRAQKQLKTFDLFNEIINHPNVILLEPLGYLEMLRLNSGAKIVLTDSGGLQEECTVLGTPCLTLRWNTERPITLRNHGGASILVGNNIEKIKNEFYNTINLEHHPSRPKLWDGKTAKRCLEAILNYSI